MASNAPHTGAKPKPKKKSLLGPHSSDDYDYWENFTEKLKLPPALVAKLEENKKHAEEAQNNTDLDYEHLPDLPEELEEDCCKILCACFGCGSVARFEPIEPPGEFASHVLYKHNQLRKKHSAKPLALAPELNQMAVHIAHTYAKKKKNDDKTTSKKSMRMYEGEICDESVLYKCGHVSMTKVTGYEAVQYLYDSGKNYSYDNVYDPTQEKFYRVIARNLTHIGVGKVTVLVDSFKYYCRTKLCRPEERTYVVFLYYPPINFKHRHNLKINIGPEKVASILKPEGSNTIITVKSDSGSTIGMGDAKKKISITEFDTEFLNWYKSKSKGQTKARKQEKPASKPNKVHPTKPASPKESDDYTDYDYEEEKPS